MTGETYIGIMTTANFALIGGIYKLCLTHISDRDLHVQCGKNKMNVHKMKNYAVLFALLFLFTGCNGLKIASLPSVETTPAGATVTNAVLSIVSPIGTVPVTTAANGILDVILYVLAGVGGSAALAAIPLIRRIKPIVPLLDILGCNFFGAANRITSPAKTP